MSGIDVSRTDVVTGYINGPTGIAFPRMGFSRFIRPGALLLSPAAGYFPAGFPA
jgi:hypothetical protein